MKKIICVMLALVLILASAVFVGAVGNDYPYTIYVEDDGYTYEFGLPFNPGENFVVCVDRGAYTAYIYYAHDPFSFYSFYLGDGNKPAYSVGNYFDEVKIALQTLDLPTLVWTDHGEAFHYGEIEISNLMKFYLSPTINWSNDEYQVEMFSNVWVVKNGVDIGSVSINVSTSAPYYPGADVQLNAQVNGTGIDPGTPESTVYWYVHGNTSPDTIIDNDGKLMISNDETAAALEVEAISTYDSTKRAAVSVPVTYPLNLQIAPAQTTIITSAKRQEIQFELLLPNGLPFDYSLLEWTTPGADGQYFRIDENGLLEILPGAPAGSVTVKYAYQHDAGNVSTSSAIVTITSQQEGIYDELDDLLHGDHGFDPGGSDFSGAADDLQNSQQQMQGAMSGGMDALGSMMQSSAMVGTLTTLGGAFGAVFEGHEITICGVTANPFTLLVSILGVAALLLLALNYIFRKRGG